MRLHIISFFIEARSRMRLSIFKEFIMMQHGYGCVSDDEVDYLFQSYQLRNV
jgi:hypothetical protein